MDGRCRSTWRGACVKGGHGAFSLAVLGLASRHGLVLYQSCRSHFFHDDGTSHVSVTLESFFW